VAGNGKVVGLAFSGQKYRGNEVGPGPLILLTENGKLETA
jgi:hypothetical protein